VFGVEFGAPEFWRVFWPTVASMTAVAAFLAAAIGRFLQVRIQRALCDARDKLVIMLDDRYMSRELLEARFDGMRAQLGSISDRVNLMRSPPVEDKLSALRLQIEVLSRQLAKHDRDTAP
jgi:hypothetical protein